MEQDSYYFRVGVFVALALAMAVFVIGFFSSKSDDEGHTAYAIYFTGSVEGLSKGSPVRLRGIQVGFVKEIAFVARGEDTIRVLTEILDTAPIHSNTRATLQMQGITGSSFVALENIDEKAEKITAKDKDQYLMITSRPSSLERVFNAVPELIDQITKLSVQGQKMLSDDNARSVHETLDSLNAAVKSLGNLIGNGKQGLEVHETLQQLNEMVGEAKQTLREVKMLARTLRDDPSLLIHGVKHEGVKLQ